MNLLGLNLWVVIGLAGGTVGLYFLVAWFLGRGKAKKQDPTVSNKASENNNQAENGCSEDSKESAQQLAAVIINADNVWKIDGRIDTPLVTSAIVSPDGTLPEAGKYHYLVKKDKKGKIASYDPRDDKIDSALTPENLFQAVFEWPDTIPYIDPISWMDKLPTLLAYIIAFATFIGVIITLGGK